MPQSQVLASRKAGQLTILLTGGGTGGHITPLLSLAHALKTADPDCQIVYVGHKGDKFDRLEEHFHDFDAVAFIKAGKFRRYYGRSLGEELTDLPTLFLNARDFLRLFGSTARAYKILKEVRPQVVFSKGGFVALPIGIAARFARIPIVTHDSDAIPGLTNRIIGHWASIHTTAMPAEFYSYPKGSVRHVGIPIDDNIRKVTPPMQAQFKKETGLPSGCEVLLIAGGSSGAKNINDKLLSVVPKLLADNPKLYVVHIAGQKNEPELSRRYAEALGEKSLARLRVLGFTNDFYKYASAADLIVSRAGASSLAEFAAAAKACILIPSPFLTGGHQVKNAQQLQKAGAVEVIDETTPAVVLQQKITQLLADRQRRMRLAEKLNSTASLGAADKIAAILLDLARQKVSRG